MGCVLVEEGGRGGRFFVVVGLLQGGRSFGWRVRRRSEAPLPQCPCSAPRLLLLLPLAMYVDRGIPRLRAHVVHHIIQWCVCTKRIRTRRRDCLRDKPRRNPLHQLQQNRFRYFAGLNGGPTTTSTSTFLVFLLRIPFPSFLQCDAKAHAKDRLLQHGHTRRIRARGWDEQFIQ